MKTTCEHPFLVTVFSDSFQDTTHTQAEVQASILSGLHRILPSSYTEPTPTRTRLRKPAAYLALCPTSPAF